MKYDSGTTEIPSCPSDVQPPAVGEVLQVCVVYTAVTFSCDRLWISTNPSMKGGKPTPAGKRLTISEQSISKASSGPSLKPLNALTWPVMSADSGPAIAAFFAKHALDE